MLVAVQNLGIPRIATTVQLVHVLIIQLTVIKNIRLVKLNRDWLKSVPDSSIDLVKNLKFSWIFRTKSHRVK